jgi:hypothetical protein
MNSTTIGFWRIFAKTLGSLLTNTDSKRDIHSKARQARFFVFLGLFIMSSLFGYEHYINTNIQYPSLNEMTLSEGNLTEVKKGKFLHYQLTTKQGEKIQFERSFPPEEGMFYNKETKEWLSHPAKVRWYMQPSGLGEITELYMEGKQYRTNDQSKKAFERYQQNHNVYLSMVLFLTLALWSVIGEYYYVKKSIMEANNGN